MTVSGSGWRRIAWSFGWLALGASLAAHGQWDYPYYIVQPKDPWEFEKNRHGIACVAQNLNPCPEFELFAEATLPPSKHLAASGTPVTRKAGLFLTEVARVFAQVGLREPDFDPKVTTDESAEPLGVHVPAVRGPRHVLRRRLQQTPDRRLLAVAGRSLLDRLRALRHGGARAISRGPVPVPGLREVVRERSAVAAALSGSTKVRPKQSGPSCRN